MKSKHTIPIHRGIHWKRTLYIPGHRERVFADEWERENAPENNCNSSHLELLLTKRGVRKQVDVNSRDAMIAASVVQWLGTNCGFSWLEETLKKAGYNLTPVHGDSTGNHIHARVCFSREEFSMLTFFKSKNTQVTPIDLRLSLGLSSSDTHKIYENLAKLGLLEMESRPSGNFVSLTKLGKLFCASHFAELPNKDYTVCVRVEQEMMEKFCRRWEKVEFKGESGAEVPEYRICQFGGKRRLP